MLLPGFGPFSGCCPAPAGVTAQLGQNVSKLVLHRVLRQMCCLHIWSASVAPLPDALDKLVSTPYTYFRHSAPPGRGSLARGLQFPTCINRLGRSQEHSDSQTGGSGAAQQCILILPGSRLSARTRLPTTEKARGQQSPHYMDLPSNLHQPARPAMTCRVKRTMTPPVHNAPYAAARPQCPPAHGRMPQQ